MKKIKIILTLLTIAIIVAPIAIEVLIYRNNLINLIVPPAITNMFNGNNNSNGGSSNPQLQVPQMVGDPQFDPQTNTITFTFNLTNPLQTPISINELETGIASHNDGFFLGNVSIDKPVTLGAGQTVNLNASGVLSDAAVNYLKTNYAGQSSINVDLTNLNVNMAGISVELNKQNVGNIAIPQSLG